MRESSNSLRKSRNRWWPLAMICFIGIVYAFLSTLYPYVGDDLLYSSRFHKYRSDLPTLLSILRTHYTVVDGRLGDLSNMIFLAAIPGWLKCFLEGFMFSLMLFMIMKWSGVLKKSVSLSMACLCVLVFGLCWWDVSWLFVIRYNYCWTTAVVLVAMWMILRTPPMTGLPLVGCCIFSLLAGWMHEAAGAPMAIAAAFYFIINRKRDFKGKENWIILFFFFIGAFISMKSQGIWNWFNHPYSAPDDPMGILAVENLYFVIILYVAMAVLWLCNRQKIKYLLSTEWIIFPLAALGSSAFSLASGIVGRSGWFAQIFAIIALFQLLYDSKWKIPRWVAAIWIILSSSAIVGHYLLLMKWQIALSAEEQDIIDLYVENIRSGGDGVIYYDATPDSVVPNHLLLFKQKSPIDSDDYYDRFCIANFLGDRERIPVVLPTSMKGFDPKGKRFPYPTEGKDFVVDTPPQIIPKNVFMNSSPALHNLTIHNGTEYTADSISIDGKPYWYLRPRQKEIADR